MLNAKKGFTLSELLVSLAVLGLIAAFAIPKVLSSVGNASFVANAKEAISTISSAFDSKKAALVTATGTTSVAAINVIPVNGNMVCTGSGATWTYPGSSNFTTLGACQAGLDASGTGYSMIGSMLYSRIGSYTNTAANLPDTFTPSATVPAAGATNAVLFGNNAIIAFNGLDLIGSESDSPTRGTIVFKVDADGVGTMKPFNVVLGADGRVLVPASATLTGPLSTGYSLTLGGTALTPFAVDATTSSALGAVINS